ncbi:hypothetical protein PR003_g12600 [Phytophthora rubi]|uniref:Uncharacterized protein n=1 Tax=Phytophthora rubi TaxID=129364 RepID=A0A6A4F4M9_9STRA|nr:hypothetical protein PR003_g12600 [Phytophthora rubi]
MTSIAMMLRCSASSSATVTLTQYRGINPLRVSIPHSSVFPV